MGKYIITGGLGYIGSVTAARLLVKGKSVLVYNEPSPNAHLRYYQLRKISARSLKYLSGTMSECSGLLENIAKDDAVIYLANRRGINESLSNPLYFWLTNVAQFILFLDKLKTTGCNKLVFGSSCAVYKPILNRKIRENSNTAPSTPFARTKKTAEKLLMDLSGQSLNSIILRYFNVRGTYKKYDLFDKIDIKNDLFIKIFSALEHNKKFEVDAEEMDVSKKQPILRDYVHVVDVADANILAANKLMNGYKGCEILNIGNAKGYGLRDIIQQVEKITCKSLELIIQKGSLETKSHLIADISKAHDVLNWKPEHSFTDIVKDSWDWYSNQ